MRSSSTAAVGGLAVLLALVALMLVTSFDSPIVLAQTQQATDPNANVAKKEPPPGSRKSSVWTQERMRTAKPTPIPRVDPNTIKKSGRPSRGVRQAAIRAIPVRAVPGSREMSPVCR